MSSRRGSHQPPPPAPPSRSPASPVPDPRRRRTARTSSASPSTPTNAYGDRQAATFCFDTALQTAYTAANFFVKTYDANRFLQGQTAAVDPGNGACVIVTFNPQIDLATQGSLGEVDAVRGPEPRQPAQLLLQRAAHRLLADAASGPDRRGRTCSARPRARATSRSSTSSTSRSTGPPENINAGAFGVVDNDGTEVAGRQPRAGRHGHQHQGPHPRSRTGPTCRARRGTSTAATRCARSPMTGSAVAAGATRTRPPRRTRWRRRAPSSTAPRR